MLWRPNNSAAQIAVNSHVVIVITRVTGNRKSDERRMVVVLTALVDNTDSVPRRGTRLNNDKIEFLKLGRISAVRLNRVHQ